LPRREEEKLAVVVLLANDHPVHLVIEGEASELGTAAALRVCIAPQKVINEVLQPSRTCIELLVPVPDPAAAARARHTLAPVARLPFGNPVVALNLSLAVYLWTAL
jgi:hypothetical protein